MSNRSSASRRAALRAQQEADAKRKRTNRIMIVAFSVIAAIIIGIVGFVVWQEVAKTTKVAGAQITPPNATADYGVMPYKSVTAKDGAPKVVIWEDAQCPYCKYTSDAWSTTLHSLAEKGEITLEYRVVNFLDAQLNNDASLRAGRGAIIADKFGMFPKYIDAVYAKQPAKEGDGFTDKLLRDEIPAQIGLSGDQLAEFQKLYDDKAADEFVKKTNAKWMSDKIGSTPAIYVNGNKIDLLGQDANGKLATVVPANDDSLLKYLKEKG